MRHPFIFHRTVVVKGNPIKVEVDFLAGEYECTGPGHRTRVVREGRARKACGYDLAFDRNVEADIEGELPEGGLYQARIRVSSVLAFLVMKGMALHDRLKQKDAWGVYFTLTNYPGGLDAFVRQFKPHPENGLVNEGLRKVVEKSASPENVSPKFLADFDEIDDPDDSALRARDASEHVNYLLTAPGVQ